MAILGGTLTFVNMTQAEITIQVEYSDDKAAVVDPGTGGIDFNASKSLTASGDRADFTFDPAALEQFRRGEFGGITPVIMRITPVQGLFPILGVEPAGR